MTTERNESTCPGPNGNGCDCKAEGKDPLCPWWPLHPEDVADESPAATTESRPWRVIVNGQPTMLPITPETRFDRIVKPALEQTGNTRYPEDAWEIRDRRGRLLYNGGRLGFDTVGALQERGEIEDETLWINLKPGIGA